MDNDPKHTVKAIQEKKWNILQWLNQSSDVRADISVTED